MRLLFRGGTRCFLRPRVSFCCRRLRVRLGFRFAVGTRCRLSVFGTRGGWSGVRRRFVLSRLILYGVVCSGFTLLLVCARGSCLLLSRSVLLCLSRSRLTFSSFVLGDAICGGLIRILLLLVYSRCLLLSRSVFL